LTSSPSPGGRERRGRRFCRRALTRFNERDHAAARNTVVLLDLDLAHGAGERRGHFHRGLGRLQRDQTLILLDPVAGFHQHLDDRHVGEIADVRYGGFAGVGHACPLLFRVIQTLKCRAFVHPRHGWPGTWLALMTCFTVTSCCGNGMLMPSASKRSLTVRVSVVCASQRSLMCAQARITRSTVLAPSAFTHTPGSGCSRMRGSAAKASRTICIARPMSSL